MSPARQIEMHLASFVLGLVHGKVHFYFHLHGIGRAIKLAWDSFLEPCLALPTGTKINLKKCLRPIAGGAKLKA